MRRIEPVSCANVKDASPRERLPRGVMQHAERRRCENRRVKSRPVTSSSWAPRAARRAGVPPAPRAGRGVRALVRSTSDPAARARLEANGVRCFEGDIEQPRDARAPSSRAPGSSSRRPPHSRWIRAPTASRASTARASSPSSPRPRPPASSGSSSSRSRRPRPTTRSSVPSARSRSACARRSSST